MTDRTREEPHATAFGIEVSSDARTTLVRLVGEIDIAASDALSRVDGETLPPATQVVVDLSAVTFLDSVGVSFLVRLATQVQEQGRTVALHGVPPAVQEVLVLVGAAELFDVPG